MVELVLNLAFVLYVGASWLRNDLWLRITLMASSVCSLIVGVLIASPSMAGWNAAFVIVMGFRICRVVLAEQRIDISPEEAWIRAAVFPTMSRVDFVRLWEAGEEQTFIDEPLVVEGEPTDRLVLVLGGSPRVVQGSDTVARLGSGQFAGEMAFATGALASATVEPAGAPIRCRAWSTEALKGLLRTSPDLEVAFEKGVSIDLAAKIGANHRSHRAPALTRF